MTTDKIFDMVEDLRKDVKVPMVFMTYANVVFSYGIERFAKKAAAVGMDGVILPDVPFEEKEEFASVFRKEGMDLISLIAPTSHDRISMIAKEAEGFVYCVSSLGVTGMRSQITTDVGAMVELVKKSSDIPAAIGFRYLRTGAGEENGRCLRWCHRRIRHRETGGEIRQRCSALCG